MAGFTKKQLETILKDTQEHLAETKRLGPGYYRIRERYDYAIESDERYIEKLRKQIAEYDQDKLNKNQQIVLEWLKEEKEERCSFESAIYWYFEDDVEPDIISDRLTQREFLQVLAAFAEWGMKNG
ncbi:hypothetical protein EGCR1_08995 [Enterococcus gilvus]|jgi:hypothetical protein|uniref:hypothetical protein n=1 Tax=Enterococcus gilvus TaxID=160453 RepID=UPI000DF62EF4|nr:hypothetical protein [Enterococcus gilvus]AXG38836.1 hypothetical protein EGCR1_08995 [Enterococcus gilvus]